MLIWTTKECLINKEYGKLITYENAGNSAHNAVPTNEHYLPLIYVTGLQSEDDNISFIYEGFQNSSISMRSFILNKS